MELDGTVIIDGDTAVFQSGGVYTKFLEKPDGKAHKIEIHSASGQKSSFEIAPAPSFKLKAINGKTSDFEVDITKDLVLEFELSPQARGKLMSVSMISSMPGGRDFNEIQPFYAAPKVTIPAGSFKSTQISGDANAVVLYPQAGFGIEGRNILNKATVQNWYVVNGYSVKGVPFSEKEFKNVEALNRILQKEMIVASFEKAIAELVEKQRAAQVAECWNLMIK